MNFEKYLIAEESSSSGFLGALSHIPNEEIVAQNMFEVQQEITALESYADAIMSQLFSPIAMESTSDSDNVSRIAAKARMAGEKIKDGKKSGNTSLIKQGTSELSASMKELNVESKKAKDPKAKAKIWTVAKVIGAVLASALLVLGAITAGKALSKGTQTSSSDKNALKAGAKAAAQAARGDKVIEEMRQLTKETEETLAQHRETARQLSVLTAEMEKTAQMAASLSQQVKQQSGGVVTSTSPAAHDVVIIREKDGSTRKVTREQFDQMRKTAEIQNREADERTKKASEEFAQRLISKAGAQMEAARKQNFAKLQEGIKKQSAAMTMCRVKMPDGTVKSMPFSEAMQSKGKIVIESLIAIESAIIFSEEMFINDRTDLQRMNMAAMEATGDDIDTTSTEVVEKAQNAYNKLKTAKNEAEKTSAAAELDSAAKDMVAGSMKAKDPGSKARWKQVAKIVGGIAASVAAIAGAGILYKKILEKTVVQGAFKIDPRQAEASMKSATTEVRKVNVDQLATKLSDLASSLHTREDDVIAATKSKGNFFDSYKNGVARIVHDGKVELVGSKVLMEDPKYANFRKQFNLDPAGDFDKSVQRAISAGVPSGQILKTKKDIDNYFTN